MRPGEEVRLTGRSPPRFARSNRGQRDEWMPSEGWTPLFPEARIPKPNGVCAWCPSASPSGETARRGVGNPPVKRDLGGSGRRALSDAAWAASPVRPPRLHTGVRRKTAEVPCPVSIRTGASVLPATHHRGCRLEGARAGQGIHNGAKRPKKEIRPSFLPGKEQSGSG